MYLDFLSWVQPQDKLLGGILLIFLGKGKHILMERSIFNTGQILSESVCLIYYWFFKKSDLLRNLIPNNKQIV